jgi:hypothetical protein
VAGGEALRRWDPVKSWEVNGSMGDLQDPTDGGTVPYKYHFSGHFFWGYSLKLRPYYPGMAIEQDLEAFPKIPRVTKKSKKP